jgi:hypothetical protein
VARTGRPGWWLLRYRATAPRLCRAPIPRHDDYGTLDSPQAALWLENLSSQRLCRFSGCSYHRPTLERSRRLPSHPLSISQQRTNAPPAAATHPSLPTPDSYHQTPCVIHRQGLFIYLRSVPASSPTTSPLTRRLRFRGLAVSPALTESPPTADRLSPLTSTIHPPTTTTSSPHTTVAPCTCSCLRPDNPI